MLLLDEAESFLADRRAARARWELTETNELLTQMERFAGLFVCTTSVVERLTPGDFAAVARRFRVLGETPQAEAFVAALGGEVELKGDGVGQRIGF